MFGDDIQGAIELHFVSAVSYDTDKNVIPEGSTASILIRPDFITDPVTVALEVTGAKDKVTLSPASFTLSKAPSNATFVISVADDKAPQTEDIEFGLSFTSPYFAFSPAAPTYIIPPNDLEAVADVVTFKDRGESQDMTLTINNLTGQKSFMALSLSLIHI